jgi:hypothetical protein
MGSTKESKDNKCLRCTCNVLRRKGRKVLIS